jgi:hypothetical protein
MPLDGLGLARISMSRSSGNLRSFNPLGSKLLTSMNLAIKNLIYMKGASLS